MLYVQELYILRLAVSVSERDDDLKQLDSLRDLIAKHEVEHAGAIELLEAHHAVVAGVQGNLEEMRAKERGMDKNFKREMNDMGITEPDTLTMLTQLYKTPSSVKIGGWRQASDDHLLEDVTAMIAKAEAEGPVPIDDPFFEAKLSQEANSSERLEQAERDAALQPLDLENDLPEGL